MSDALQAQAGHQNETFGAIPNEGDKLSDGRMAQIKVPQKGWVEDYGIDNVPLLGDAMSDYEERLERFQATNDEADSVMRRYGSQTDDVVVRTPEFKQPTQESAPPPQQPQQYGGSAAGAMAGAGYSSTPQMNGSAAAGSSSVWSSGGGVAAGGSYSPSGGSVPSSQAAAGSSSAWAPGGVLPPGAVRGSDGMAYRQSPDGTWQRQNPYNGRWAPAPQGPPGVAGGGAGRGRGGLAAGGRADGGFGPRGSGSPLAGGGRAGSGGVGPGGGSQAAQAAGGSGGRGGMVRGAPMAAGGGQQRGDGAEQEHERPTWLVETEDVFTNDMHRVAPPVLGALPHEEQGR
ncbi:hypothetical protein [Halopolyspora algeriensis]|uniref:hypothetical protein n=1 Tax=Halopolyspora algeriensis TaxID=1500506 RepID=UPI001FE8897E|nr:hypothetical protein [Halopolyspora algeriensis]